MAIVLPLDITDNMDLLHSTDSMDRLDSTDSMDSTDSTSCTAHTVITNQSCLHHQSRPR